MVWICQLGNGYMLGRANDVFKKVNTGYPYPDTKRPQQEMLVELYAMVNIAVTLDYVERHYSKIIDGLNAAFDSQNTSELELCCLLKKSLTCVAECLHRDSSYSCYAVDEIGDLIFKLDVERVQFVCHGRCYLILPHKYEKDFEDILDIPAGCISTFDQAQVILLDGFREPTLLQSIYGNVATMRLEYAVFPALKLDVDCISGLDFNEAGGAWFSDLSILKLDAYVRKWGATLQGMVDRFKRARLISRLDVVCSTDRYLISSTRIAKSDYIKLTDQDLVTYLQDDSGLSGSFRGRWIWRRGFVKVSDDNSGLLFSLSRMFGKDLWEFVYYNILHMSHQPLISVESCRLHWAEILGITEGELAKLLLLSGKVTIGTEVGVHFKSCSGVTSAFLGLCCGLNVSLAHIVYTTPDRIMVSVPAFPGMPDLIRKRIDFNNLKLRFGLELKACILWSIWSGLQFRDFKLMDAFYTQFILDRCDIELDESTLYFVMHWQC